MFDRLRVTTPEGVTFSHDLAGVGSRSLATVLDLLIFAGVMIVSMFLFFMISLACISMGLVTDPSSVMIIGITLTVFGYLWGYRAVMETWKSGSIGYKAAGITVVTRRGAKPMFWQCAIRGLLWPVEVVSFTLIAFIAIIMSQHSQRLADMIAGTMVVYRERSTRLGTLVVQDAALDPNAAFRSWELSQVSDDEVFLIRRYLDRRTSLAPHIRLDLAQRLYALIWPKVSGIPTTWYAEAVLEGIAASRSVANER